MKSNGCGFAPTYVVTASACNSWREWKRAPREVGFAQLYLETGYAQPEAVALYSSTGWERVDEFPEGTWSHPGAYRFTKVL